MEPSRFGRLLVHSIMASGFCEVSDVEDEFLALKNGFDNVK